MKEVKRDVGSAGVKSEQKFLSRGNATQCLARVCSV